MTKRNLPIDHPSASYRFGGSKSAAPPRASSHDPTDRGSIRLESSHSAEETYARGRNSSLPPGGIRILLNPDPPATETEPTNSRSRSIAHEPDAHCPPLQEIFRSPVPIEKSDRAGNRSRQRLHRQRTSRPPVSATRKYPSPSRVMPSTEARRSIFSHAGGASCELICLSDDALTLGKWIGKHCDAGPLVHRTRRPDHPCFWRVIRDIAQGRQWHSQPNDHGQPEECASPAVPPAGHEASRDRV